MAVQVYTFQITYLDCENRIWRTAEVSSNYLLAQLGYLVLATFDTMAYHLFQMKHKNNLYLLSPEEAADFSSKNPWNDLPTQKTHFRSLYEDNIGSLDMQIKDIIEMTYDFGCCQEFQIELMGICEMEKGHGRAYPRIVDGAGRGIMDDLSAEDLLQIIRDIDRGQNPEIVYPPDSAKLWDYRDYSLKADNALLKSAIQQISCGYEENR